MTTKYGANIIILAVTLLFTGCGGSSGSDTGNTDNPPTQEAGKPKPDPLTNRSPIVTKINAIDVQENSLNILTVQAEDPDNNALSFSLDNSLPDSALLHIDANGTLAFNNAPNYENPLDENADNTYETRINVSDGLASVTFNLNVNVKNVATNAPVNTAPTIISGNYFEIPENTTFVGKIIASDKEENPLTFKKNNSGDQFYFEFPDSTSGVLDFFSPPNYEQPDDHNRDNTYELNVTVSDGELSVSFDVTVVVTDANDPPVITTTGNFVARLNQPFSQQIYVTDEDGTTNFSYDIANIGDSQWFKISPTGLLEFAQAPAFNTPYFTEYYRITVSASDGDKFDTSDLTIRLLNDIGRLDTGFGNIDPLNGMQRLGYVSDFITTDTGKNEQAHDMAVLSNNNLVVVGQSFNSDTNSIDMTMWQYTDQGVLNTDLANGFGPVDPADNTKRLGYVTHDILGGDEIGYAVAITADDKIVVVGTSKRYSTAIRNDRQDSVVWRFLPNGQWDDSFGIPDANNSGKRIGYVTHNTASSSERGFDLAKAVAIGSDGSVFVTGYRRVEPVGPGPDMVVWKFTPEGDLDHGFGIASTNQRLGYAILSDASSAFGGWGRDIGNAIAETQDGKIIVVGTSDLETTPGYPPKPETVVWCYTALGELDVGAFGHSYNGAQVGYLMPSYAQNSDYSKSNFYYGNAVAITPDNKILLTSSARTYSNSDFDMALIRLTSDGILETDPVNGFGRLVKNGYTDHHLGFNYHDANANPITNDYANAIAFTPDGKIVVAGYTERTYNVALYDSVLWRFDANGLFEGYTEHNINDGNDVTDKVAIDSNGNIITLGSSTQNITGMVIKRFVAQ